MFDFDRIRREAVDLQSSPSQPEAHFQSRFETLSEEEFLSLPAAELSDAELQQRLELYEQRQTRRLARLPVLERFFAE